MKENKIKAVGANGVTIDQIIALNDLDLSRNQVQAFFKKTPADKIKTRPGKGGGTWKYVDGGYVIFVLNALTGFDWNLEIETSVSEALQVATATGVCVVKGRLKLRLGDHYVEKTQFGRAEVKFKKGTEKQPLDFGNDMKAAATDALKKCSATFGLFSDVYNADDFRSLNIIEERVKADKKIVVDEIMEAMS